MFNREDLTPPGSDVRYLVRWTLLRWGSRAIYLHKLVGSDWAREPHDHPKDFVSIGLWGSYTEQTWMHTNNFAGYHKFRDQKWSAPWFRRFPSKHIHRLIVTKGPVWTLVFVGKRKQDWGFFNDEGDKILFEDYLSTYQSEERYVSKALQRARATSQTYAPLYRGRT